MSDELIPGNIVEIAAGVRRLIAPNPSMMTGPGTNSYLLGDQQVAVLDPGPAIGIHIDRLSEVANLRWIIVTHTHPDHSPAAMEIAARTGAELLGLPAPSGPHQDDTFTPNRQPGHNERLETEEFTIRFIHTPGHASNHVCLLHEGHQWLFTGDHVMGGSTVVIDPPDGDMSAYLESLAELRELELEAIAPGHGPVLQNPRETIDWLIEHRLKREEKVLAAVTANPGLDSNGLVPTVYKEIDQRLHRLAERSLLAHLIKLERDGRVRRIYAAWWPQEA